MKIRKSFINITFRVEKFPNYSQNSCSIESKIKEHFNVFLEKENRKHFVFQFKLLPNALNICKR